MRVILNADTEDLLIVRTWTDMKRAMDGEIPMNLSIREVMNMELKKLWRGLVDSMRRDLEGQDISWFTGSKNTVTDWSRRRHGYTKK